MPLLSDNLDDRREIHRQLHAMPPQKRVEVLAHFCGLAKTKMAGSGVRPGRDMADKVACARRSDAADELLTNEIWSNLWVLTNQYGVDEAVMRIQMEKFARRG